MTIGLFRPLLRIPTQIQSVYSVRVHRLSSALSIYSSFPASLFRYNVRQKFSLYDGSKRDEEGDKPYWDGIEVSKDGLVQLGTSKNPGLYRGAMLMPNTFTMQEIIRTEIDCYFDNEELGRQVEIPFIYTVQKGTPIPSDIVLLQEDLSRFSLQPSQPMSVEDFNTLLDEFYEKYAERKTAEQWLGDNDFNSAVGDDAVAVWMSR